MAFLLPVLAFLIAATPFGLILGRRLKGIDIREHGSGNIGSTNVFRVLGKGPGIVCLILDISKGFLPVLLAINLLQYTGQGMMLPEIPFLTQFRETLPASQQYFVQTMHVVTALFAILGHNYSPWLRFQGGKGIATSAGVMLALMPFAILILIALFLIVFLTTRYVSVASLSAAAMLPVLTIGGSWHHGRIQDGTWNIPLFIFSLLVSVLAIWKHRGNIQRLRNGTENRFVKKKKP